MTGYVDFIRETWDTCLESSYKATVLSEGTISDHIDENERTCATIFVDRTISSASLIVTEHPTETIPETRTFTEQDAQEIVNSPPLTGLRVVVIPPNCYVTLYYFANNDGRRLFSAKELNFVISSVCFDH